MILLHGMEVGLWLAISTLPFPTKGFAIVHLSSAHKLKPNTYPLPNPRQRPENLMRRPYMLRGRISFLCTEGGMFTKAPPHKQTHSSLSFPSSSSLPSDAPPPSQTAWPRSQLI